MGQSVNCLTSPRLALAGAQSSGGRLAILVGRRSVTECPVALELSGPAGRHFAQALEMAGNTARDAGVAASGRELWVWGGAGAFSSIDTGRTWRHALRMPVVALAFRAPFVVAVTTTAGCRLSDVREQCPGALITSHDGGSHWQSYPLAHATSSDQVSATAGAVAYATIAARSVYATSDGGRHWARRNLGAPGVATTTGLAAPRVALAPDGVLWEIIGGGPGMSCAFQGKALYQSTDQARTWRRVAAATHNATLQYGCVGSLTAPAPNTLLLTRQTASTALSHDGGTTWTSAPFGSTIDDQSPGWASFATPSDGLVGPAGENVYRTTDSGGSWTRAALPHQP